MKKYLLFLFLGFLCVSASAQKLPKPTDWVSDYAGIMDARSIDKTRSIINELEQKTSTEIAVVTVKNLDNQSIEDFAVNVFKQWGIGKKGKDNGILFIASIEDRKIKIEVGYGLEGILNDGKCGEILDRYVVPEFKKGDYGNGMFLGTLAIASVIAADAGVQLTGQEQLPPEPQQKTSLARLILQGLFFVVMIILFIRHPFLFLLLLGAGGGGGGSRGGFGGGFGGFGGGSSGGGGASRGF
ncbi:MAG: TPM domain-containing protein [Endomicrobiales bacterium]